MSDFYKPFNKNNIDNSICLVYLLVKKGIITQKEFEDAKEEMVVAYNKRANEELNSGKYDWLKFGYDLFGVEKEEKEVK